MGKLKHNIPAQAGDFNWDLFDDGWNGSSLKVNKKVKTGDKHTKVFSHDTYAGTLIKQYLNMPVPVSKELRKDTIVTIDNFMPSSNNNQILASINGGANNIVIDLNKEQRFFNTMTVGDEVMTKETFLACLDDPDVKAKILEMGLVAKIGTDVEKASIWDGYVENLSNEMREQIHLNKKAYIAKVLSSNNGGFVVEVADTVKAFMPGSMAAANKLTNYEALVGTSMEVMVESYDKKLGFVVSRKKYLKTITPIHLTQLELKLAENKDTVLTGIVTGTTPFGIFVELDEVLTGMIHKTLMDDELRESLRVNNIEAGSAIQVYVHKIEKGRIILSNVSSDKRDEVIAKREAEDAQEKASYVTAKKETATPKINPEAVANTTSIDLTVEA